METGEKIVNRYTEKPVKAKNGFAMLALILVLALRLITREDVKMIPKGAKIAALLHIR